MVPLWSSPFADLMNGRRPVEPGECVFPPMSPRHSYGIRPGMAGFIIEVRGFAGARRKPHGGGGRGRET